MAALYRTELGRGVVFTPMAYALMCGVTLAQWAAEMARQGGQEPPTLPREWRRRSERIFREAEAATGLTGQEHMRDHVDYIARREGIPNGARDKVDIERKYRPFYAPFDELL